MSPEERDASYLYDMLEYARSVENTLKGLSFDEYENNENLRLSIERRIEIIGEAARRVSTTFKEAHPEIPRKKIIAHRNLLIHEYGEV